jgi:hypothetical protein
MSKDFVTMRKGDEMKTPEKPTAKTEESKSDEEESSPGHEQQICVPQTQTDLPNEKVTEECTTEETT